MSTIREIIKEKSERLRDISNIPPMEASESLVELSSLLSTLNAYISDKQFMVNQKRASLLQEAKSVAKARLLTEATTEWKEWFEAVMQRDAMLEMIRALKYHIRGLENEYKVIS